VVNVAVLYAISSKEPSTPTSTIFPISPALQHSLVQLVVVVDWGSQSIEKPEIEKPETNTLPSEAYK
jgi:hypothetical protein